VKEKGRKGGVVRGEGRGREVFACSRIRIGLFDC